MATFALGPGGTRLQNGFPNFVVAVAMLARLPLLAVHVARPAAHDVLAALGAAAIGVAHNWSLLLGTGGVAAVVVSVSVATLPPAAGAS